MLGREGNGKLNIGALANVDKCEGIEEEDVTEVAAEEDGGGGAGRLAGITGFDGDMAAAVGGWKRCPGVACC